jgi:hypothetical protein
MNKIVKSSQDIHCDKCGKYLFTIDEIIKSSSVLTYEARENDNDGYGYLENEDIFVCNECLES